MSEQFTRLALDFEFIDGIRFNLKDGYPESYDRKRGGGFLVKI